MVNFRFHLVSLTAVFLALAAGIAIGAGVVDRQTVGFLEARLRTVENNRAETNADNDRLQGELGQWERFAEQAGDRMVEGRLQDVPIVVVAVDGTDRELVEQTRTTLQAAGATVQGSLWLTERWALADGEDVEALATIVGASPTSRPQDLRGLAVANLVSSWNSGLVAEVAIPLRDAGFLEFEAAPGQAVTIEQVTLNVTDVVVMSSAEATTPNVDLAVPVVRAFVEAGIDAAAAEPERPETTDEGEGDEPAVGAALAVRADEDLAGRVSTVDNVDDYRGRIALVFALDDLAAGQRGHYGTGEGAQRLLPELPG